MGPFEEVSSISAGTAHIINMGQINTIGRILLDFEVGPLVVPIHFYSMGPCGLFQLQRSNCTWVVPTTTTKVFDIMCSLRRYIPPNPKFPNIARVLEPTVCSLSPVNIPSTLSWMHSMSPPPPLRFHQLVK